MNIHEYQGKSVLKQIGAPVAEARVLLLKILLVKRAASDWLGL